jgi:hypothetical protein
MANELPHLATQDEAAQPSGPSMPHLHWQRTFRHLLWAPLQDLLPAPPVPGAYVSDAAPGLRRAHALAVGVGPGGVEPGAPGAHPAIRLGRRRSTLSLRWVTGGELSVRDSRQIRMSAECVVVQDPVISQRIGSLRSRPDLVSRVVLARRLPGSLAWEAHADRPTVAAARSRRRCAGGPRASVSASVLRHRLVAVVLQGPPNMLRDDSRRGH